eukprot:comp21633_c0_seq1/m.30375 comp21633_c0_seq1/g.30375  ORF comp21633_c0_seq1/g.30375 comp21633_c0_seq1/m.30375 type:complete len:303 (+) comp21633_c0_seq1:553-1461(+)
MTSTSFADVMLTEMGNRTLRGSSSACSSLTSLCAGACCCCWLRACLPSASTSVCTVCRRTCTRSPSSSLWGRTGRPTIGGMTGTRMTTWPCVVCVGALGGASQLGLCRTSPTTSLAAASAADCMGTTGRSLGQPGPLPSSTACGTSGMPHSGLCARGSAASCWPDGPGAVAGAGAGAGVWGTACAPMMRVAMPLTVTRPWRWASTGLMGARPNSRSISTGRAVPRSCACSAARRSISGSREAFLLTVSPPVLGPSGAGPVPCCGWSCWSFSGRSSSEPSSTLRTGSRPGPGSGLVEVVGAGV